MRIAVTGTITVTGIMIFLIFFLRGEYIKAAIAWIVTMADALFLLANMTKIPAGGYWSLIIAFIPFSVILIYITGQRRIYKVLKPLSLRHFLTQYSSLYMFTNKIKGTALFFARDIHSIPPYIALTMFKNEIVYEDNIIISINIQDKPFGVSAGFKKKLAEGLRVFEIQSGYMEVVDIMRLLHEAGIREKTVFYGIEDIVATRPIWRVFAIIKRLSASFVQFYKLPPEKLHGVVTRIEM